MVLNVGIVSAFIVYKNRPGAMTRLQKLKKKLSEKPISTKILYSYPVKKIFSIIMILSYMAVLCLFLNQYEKQLQQKYQLKPQHHQKFKNTELIPQNINKNEHFFKLQSESSQIISSNDITNQYLNVQMTVRLIVLFFTIPLMILLRQISFQRMIVRKKKFGDPPHYSGEIEIQELSILKGWINKKNIVCQQDDIFFIELCGQQRFSHTDYYYAIKKVTKSNEQKQKQKEKITQVTKNNLNLFDNENNVKISSIQEQIVRKGNIFQVRKTLIYLCHILGKEINLSIKNGPVKRTNKSKAKLKTKKQTKSQ